MKYEPGRKSDVQDCQWLQKLMSLDFLRAAFHPDGEVCQWRAVARQRETLLTDQASWVQRMQKGMVQMNRRLTEVLSDVIGLSGSLIVRDIVAVVRNPKALAKHRHSRVKASPAEIIKALTGNWREEHLLSSKTKRWLNRVRQVLKMAAMSLARSDSALGAFYRRMCARMDPPSANMAVAHKLTRMVYLILTRGDEFVDRGQQRYEEQQLARSVAAPKHRTKTLGFEVTPVQAPV